MRDWEPRQRAEPGMLGGLIGSMFGPAASAFQDEFRDLVKEGISGLRARTREAVGPEEPRMEEWSESRPEVRAR